MPTIAVTGRAEERITPELGAVALSVGGSGAVRDDVFERTTAAHERLLSQVRRLEASGALDTGLPGNYGSGPIGRGTTRDDSCRSCMRRPPTSK